MRDIERLAGSATAGARVRDVLDGFADAGGGPALEIVAAEASEDTRAVPR